MALICLTVLIADCDLKEWKEAGLQLLGASKGRDHGALLEDYLEIRTGTECGSMQFWVTHSWPMLYRYWVS